MPQLECSGEASGTYLVAAGFSQLIVSDYNPRTGDVGDGSTIFYNAQGGVLPLELISYICSTPSGLTWLVPAAFNEWIKTNIDEKLITDPDGSLAMRGNLTESDSNVTIKWTWDLKQAGKAP
jgi:hypothetical protein